MITRRRFQRSTSAPAKGPRNTWGSMPTIEAAAKTVADPVAAVMCQINANCTRLLPNNEKACPVQTVKKVFFQLFDSPVGMDGSIDNSNHIL
jgi:hypothetical protein